MHLDTHNTHQSNIDDGPKKKLSNKIKIYYSNTCVCVPFLAGHACVQFKIDDFSPLTMVTSMMVKLLLMMILMMGCLMMTMMMMMNTFGV